MRLLIVRIMHRHDFADASRARSKQVKVIQGGSFSPRLLPPRRAARTGASRRQADTQTHKESFVIRDTHRAADNSPLRAHGGPLATRTHPPQGLCADTTPAKTNLSLFFIFLVFVSNFQEPPQNFRKTPTKVPIRTSSKKIYI